RNGDQDFVDSELFGDAPGAAGKFNQRATGSGFANLNVLPANPFGKAGSQSFHHRFFGGPATSIMLESFLVPLAVTDLFFCVNALKKEFPMLFNHVTDADDFGDVSSQA